MLPLFASFALAAPFTPPAGLRAEDTATALAACTTASPDLVEPLGGPVRFADVDLQNRAYTAYAGRTTLTSINVPFDRCPALRALPSVTDGVLRCTALPKGGYACKPIPGPTARTQVVADAVAAARPALVACVGGRDSTWTIRGLVGVDGSPGDLDISVRGATDSAVITCLTDTILGWRMGPLSGSVPLDLTVP